MAANQNTKLEEEVNKLKGKVTKLEATAQHQESLIIALQKKCKTERKLASRNSVQLEIGRMAIPRTCREAFSGDQSVPSGMYWIDPDGQGIGDDPINVYCNMATGTNVIPQLSRRVSLVVFNHSQRAVLRIRIARVNFNCM